MNNDLNKLKEESENPNLWKKPDEAKSLLKKITLLEKKIQSSETLYKEFQDLKDLFEISLKDLDESMLKEILDLSKKINTQSKKLQFENLLGDDIDINNCYLEIHAGAGGVESQDWAQMLLRMYSRWAEERIFQIQRIDENLGEEAGIKSCTIKINGDYAYGWLKHESGIHRLVRISPFDSNKRRHTSFASVWIYPEVDDKIEIDIKDSDIRIDTYRASGAGGQHVNKTDSAVRITHLPTRIVVQCQNGRSQHKNKSTALAMLKSRIYEFEVRKKEDEKQSQFQEKKDIGWGSQIRSYVLHPYQMIKDIRTGFETSDTTGVLSGSLTSFLEKSLIHFNNK